MEEKFAGSAAAAVEEAPVKRQKSSEEVVGETAGELAPGMSAIIPGWFSEISPMWPGAAFNRISPTSVDVVPFPRTTASALSFLFYIPSPLCASSRSNACSTMSDAMLPESLFVITSETQSFFMHAQLSTWTLQLYLPHLPRLLHMGASVM